MKIAFITFEYPPFIQGGAGVYGYNLTKELARLGHEVHVITPRAFAGNKESVEEGVFIHRVGFLNKPFLAAPSFWLSLRKEFSSLERQARGFHIVHNNGLSAFSLGQKAVFCPRVVTIHHLTRTALKMLEASLFDRVRNLRGEIGISPLIEPVCIKQADQIIAVSQYTKHDIVRHYAKKYGVPYVLQAHGLLLRIIAKQRLKQVYDNLWRYRLLKDASRVIALTRTEAEQYKSMGVTEDKIEIVPNGIDLSEFENLPQRGEFRKKWGINANQKVVLYLGRIDQTKGIGLLAKAFARLTKEFGETRRVVIGPDDGHLPALKALTKELGIEEKVVFTGTLYEEEKSKAYVDADVFVTPSFYGFPVTFVEACACRVPIVTTEKGDNLDWIHNQVGYVGAYDKDHLKDAISMILTDSNLTKQFGEKGKMLVRERFNWEKIAEQVEDIYMDCLLSPTLNYEKQT